LTPPSEAKPDHRAVKYLRRRAGLAVAAAVWAYGAIYGTSSKRTAALDGWLWRYNFRRKHGAIGRKPPAARLAELNNVLGSGA
jgi:hypothetical protein